MAYLIPSRSLRIAFALLLAAALAACAGAPVQEMSDARQAIKAANDAGADHVAPGQLADARSYMERAEANLQARAYRDARRNAVAARGKAVEALEAARNTAPRP